MGIQCPIVSTLPTGIRYHFSACTDSFDNPIGEVPTTPAPSSPPASSAVETPSRQKGKPVPWDPLAHDPEIVWVDCPEGKLENNNTLMAGYLGFADTKSLRSLEREQEVQIILNEFDASRELHFGITGTDREKINKGRVKMTAILKDIRDLRYHQYLELAGPILAHGTLLPSMAPLVAWMNAIHRLVIAKPDLFPKTPEGKIPLENYHKAYWFLRWVKKVNHPSRKATSSANERS